jgi:hypothetical protein
MASSDVFSWLDALWTKRRPDGEFPEYVAHRFLASDRRLAPAARVLSRDLREPELVFGAWLGLLPRGAGAPRLSYAAPKRPPAADALTERMMRVLGVSRREAEEMQDVASAAGRLADVFAAFGVEAGQEGE